MAKFKVDYPDGSSEVVEQSECTTVEQFINVKFGSAPAAKVSLVGAVEEPAKKVIKK
jgi:hypothetical protein